MLKPHPTVLRRLVEEYAAALAAATAGTPDTAHTARITDLEYTLCVSTGTRDVRHALTAAHRWLSADDAPVVPPAPAARPAAV